MKWIEKIKMEIEIGENLGCLFVIIAILTALTLVRLLGN